MNSLNIMYKYTPQKTNSQLVPSQKQMESGIPKSHASFVQ